VKPDNPYRQIVRRNGALGDFTLLDARSTGVVNGDVVKATAVGSTITCYINNTAIFSVNDTTYPSGNPGMGFYLQDGLGPPVNYGFSSYTASDGTQSTGEVGDTGYWLNHPKAWCIASIQLGCQTYTKAQALAILKQSTSRDMTYQLAAQLIATKLNITCANTNGSCVANVITAADSWLCAHPIGSKVKASSAAWKQITPTYNTLAAYNQGKLCAPPLID
jgi:hypothetical protein